MQMLDASLYDFTWKHLHIKPLTYTEENFYIALYTSPLVMQHICQPLSEEKAAVSFVQALKLNIDPYSDRLFLTVYIGKDPNPVALCSVSHFDRSKQIAELGCIVSPNQYRKSIAQNALYALALQMSKYTDIKEFTLNIHPDNLAALRLASSLGYKKCRRRTDIYFRPNDYRTISTITINTE